MKCGSKMGGWKTGNHCKPKVYYFKITMCILQTAKKYQTDCSIIMCT